MRPEADQDRSKQQPSSFQITFLYENCLLSSFFPTYISTVQEQMETWSNTLTATILQSGLKASGGMGYYGSLQLLILIFLKVTSINEHSPIFSILYYFHQYIGYYNTTVWSSVLHPFLSLQTLAVQLMSSHVKPFRTDSCRMQMLPFSFRRGHEHEYFANITCTLHSKKTKPCLSQLLQEFAFAFSMSWRQSLQLSNYDLAMWRYGFSHMLKQCAWGCSNSAFKESGGFFDSGYPKPKTRGQKCKEWIQLCVRLL